MKRIVFLLLLSSMVAQAEDLDRFLASLVRTELVDAVESNNVDLVSGVLRRGVVTELDKVQALMYATHMGFPDVVTLLINDKVDLDAKDENGNTALSIAIAQGNKTIMSLLTQAGAAYSLPNALAINDMEKIKSTVKTAAQGEKNQALINACTQGQADLVKLFLANGAQVNATGTRYEKIRTHHSRSSKIVAAGTTTPLIEACKNGYTNIIPLLLQKRANVYAKDFLGKTALNYATTPEIKQMLLNASAKKK